MSDPLRVAFDHGIFVEQQYGGITRYFARLATHLPELGITPKIIAPLYVSAHLEDVPSGEVWGRLIRPSTNKKRLAKAMAYFLEAPLARVFGADIVHESYYSGFRTAPRNAKVVTTIHDMTHEIFPDLFVPRGRVIKRKVASIGWADAVICVSENTRRDLLRFHPQVEDKVSVVHLGFDPPPPLDVESPRLHSRPYLLYVGMRRDYKNFKGLVAAFAASSRLRKDFDVVCIGDGPFRPHEREALDTAGVATNFKQCAADDRALRAWYHHAHLFVYPSLYEGFGIPPLEAMAVDCPVVAMKVSSVPEVCGDAAEYAVPDALESLQAAIEHVAYSSARADELRALGRNRLKNYSWEKCARETSDIYRRLL